MPDLLLDSRSIFDQRKVQLGQWLRDNSSRSHPLNREALEIYKPSFVAGWHIEVDDAGDTLALDVLLDRQFPYSVMRVAYRSEDVYLKWPHVEPEGMLCLPSPETLSADIAYLAEFALSSAIELIRQCQNRAFVEEELRREFIPYWNRSVDAKAAPIRSLLNAKNKNMREIAVWYGEGYTLVAETPQAALAWLRHRGRNGESRIDQGLFGYLTEAPVAPFPERPDSLFVLLERHCPAALPMLERFSVDRDLTFVMGAGSPSGTGLMGIDLLRVSSFNGFRKGTKLSLNNKLLLWRLRSRVERRKVERFDGAWVHGRGLNADQAVLAAAKVVVLGCGSLGSQVAVRLAQAGIGNLTLVDPELVEAANVGRHALGIGSVGQAKASELAAELSRRFPHVSAATALDCSWQDAYSKSAELFATADLIVACLGEWPADGPLGEWHARFRVAAPIVYGWLDELGTAAHGLALSASGPALSCVLSSNGLRAPETIWTATGAVQSEPACGTLFQPYGPLDVGQAELLVSRLCIDILTDKATPPVHRVYAGSTAPLIAAGGEWSPDHLKYRPAGYDGPFEYERDVERCGECSLCAERHG